MKVRNVLVAVLFVIGSASMSYADLIASYIDFNMDANHPSSANIKYEGGNNPLIAFDLQVDKVQGFTSDGTKTKETSLNGGVLSFTTGNLSSYDSDSKTWVFNAGGTLQVTGTPVDFTAGEYLLKSTSLGPITVRTVYDGFYSKFNIAYSSFPDDKDAALVTYFFGASKPGFLGALNLSFLTNEDPEKDGSFISSSVLDGHVYNTPVPLPEAFWLLGSGLIALVGIRRKAFFG